MLLRVVLAIAKPETQKELKRCIAHSDAVVDVIRKKDLMWERMAKVSGDIIIVSRSLIPAPEDEKIRFLRNLPESPWVIIIYEKSAPEEHAMFLAAGCEVLLPADLPSDSLKEALAAILEKKSDSVQTSVTSRRLGGAEPHLSDFVSKSPSMRTFMSIVPRVIRSDVSLLVLGETGVGKEHLARAIHSGSSRSAGPFIAVNCGAIPELLLESELFGHEEGAFTGATRARRGWFELAHRGTLFLDEIGEMPAHLQIKLLRVLQDHEIQRLGSERTIRIDVRIMAASNRDLEAEVAKGNFRKDLYYRLSVVALTVPPLRERKEDIPELAQNYVNHFRHNIDRDVTGLTPPALLALLNYSWPGNVRELMNVIERAMILCNSANIDIEDLPVNISGNINIHTNRALPDEHLVSEQILSQPLRRAKKTAMESFERSYLAGLLHKTGGRIGETAKMAGIQPRSLHEKMKHYHLNKASFRNQ